VIQYICNNCGEFYPEEQEDNLCIICYENEVYPENCSYYDEGD
jgi:formylmethanofuran dehydrogenase subunit E